MKVLTTGMEWFTENPGGLPRYFADYLNAWKKRGSPIRALVRTGQQQTSEEDRPEYLRSVFLQSQNPLKVRRVWENTLLEELQRHSYDVFNPHFAYYAWAWSKIRTDIPVVTHFHGPWAYEAKLEETGRSGLQKELQFCFQKAVERRVYRTSDRFIVLSRDFQQQLTTHYGIPEERIHIIPGAVNVERFHDVSNRDEIRVSLGLPEDALILLSVRRLARRMGLDTLIRAVGALCADFPHVYLVVVGGGEMFDELSQLITELRLEDHVVLTNRVPDELLPTYYQAADLMVMPSQHLEGFGLVTIESMACGTPVIGTPVGGTTEILEKFDPNLLFAGSSLNDITEGIGRVLTQMGKIPSRLVTREHVLKHYTWDVIIPQIQSVFSQLA